MKYDLKRYISASGLIKICIKIILLFTIILIILESKDPKTFNISEIKNLSINTPVTIFTEINPSYISHSFSIVTLEDSSGKITGIISQNLSSLNLTSDTYKIIGKTNRYNSQKQVLILSIEEIKLE